MEWHFGPEFQHCTHSASFGLIRPIPKSTFGIHNTLGLKCLYQLRVGLSPLKCHTKRHNFIHTPSDCCECYCAPEVFTSVYVNVLSLSLLYLFLTYLRTHKHCITWMMLSFIYMANIYLLTLSSKMYFYRQLLM